MATLIIDLDGTCLKYHTNEWLPGVVETLTKMAKHHQIVFVTMRGSRDPDEVWNGEATRALLAKLPFAYDAIYDATWPRVLIDDQMPQAIATPTDSADWVARLRYA
jgi:ribonucleotide monophosphatase NagD (HAD superfamily)